jgi:hypothetical protein
LSVFAVIFPPRENFRLAMLEASRAVRDPASRLYSNGIRLGWLLSPLPGWFRIGAADVRDAYEETERTAGCCDLNGGAA